MSTNTKKLKFLKIKYYNFFHYFETYILNKNKCKKFYIIFLEFLFDSLVKK